MIIHHPKYQSGYLAVLAILFILVIGALGVSITYMLSGGTLANINLHQSENALLLAGSGYEKAARFLLTPVLSGSNARLACSALSGNTNLTNASFGKGTFTVTPNSGQPNYARTTLNGALSSSATTISVASTSSFAAAGRLFIDDEIVSYGGISGNTFIGVQRGANYNVSTPHASGAVVTQYQCLLTSVGDIPNASVATYERTIQQGVALQEAWAVGNVSLLNYVLTRFNRPTELSWTASNISSLTPVNLNSISMLNYGDGWFVGAVLGTQFTIARWNGSSWNTSTTPTACAGQDLTDVSAVYSNEAWAVGPHYRNNNSCKTGGSRRYTLLKWNGSTWTLLTPSTTPAAPADGSTGYDLFGIHVIDSTQSGSGNFGFAVGSSGTILRFNGSSWTRLTAPTTQSLNAVYVVSASEAWAVGAAGVIFKWNGSTWSSVTSPTTTALNDIVMIDTDASGAANAGWAVGNNGVAIYYNGTSWVSQNTGTSTNLFGVGLFFYRGGADAWAVGASGTILHWNGSSWISVSSGVSAQLNAISTIMPQPFPFAWQEIFA